MFLVSAFRIPLSVHHMVADTTTPANRRRGDRMKVKFTYRRGDDELVQGCRLKWDPCTWFRQLTYTHNRNVSNFSSHAKIIPRSSSSSFLFYATDGSR